MCQDSKAEFKRFYGYLFNLLREEGQKSLTSEMALAIWPVVLVPHAGKGEAPEVDDGGQVIKGSTDGSKQTGALITEFIEYGTVSLICSRLHVAGTDYYTDTMLQSLGPKFKGVSSDIWSQLLDFIDSVTIDLEGYEDDSACWCESCWAMIRTDDFFKFYRAIDA